jgi:hypothetical protein
MILVFTLCSNNYLAQAISLGHSLLKHNPDYVYKIGLVDKRNSQIDYDVISYEIVEVENIGIEEWDKMILRYNIQELNTAVKPCYFNYFINSEESYENIIYLDPDILVYSPFSELENELESNDIVITPHITAPINDNNFPGENDFLNTGLYNLGFMAIRISSNSKRMIYWWANRLNNRGYNDVKNGMFTDQLWINFVPIFFEKVKLFLHPGYNMAYWNLQERAINVKKNCYFVNDYYPLVFFHFSGFFPTKPDQISKYQNRYTFSDRNDILSLFQDYSCLLELNKYEYFQSFKCYYNGIKEQHDEKIVLGKVKQIPIQKRIFKKIVNHVAKKFNIILDYRGFYERENLERFDQYGE